MTNQYRPGAARPAFKGFTTMKQVLILMLLLLANAIEAQTKRVVDVKDGQALEALLGEDMLEIDTLVVKGSLKHTDFPVMRQCLAKGNLRVIDLGESEVENDSLPENAFYISFDPVHLDSIVLPKTLRVIGNEVFCNPTMREIRFPTTLKSIGDMAFNQCNYLKTAIIPEGVESIGAGCFYSCYSLKSVSLPSTIRHLGIEAFNLCSNLMTIDIPYGIENIGPFAFANIAKIEEMVIPESVKNIEEYAFYDDWSMRKIVLPNRLTVIVNNVFEDCNRLSDVRWPSELALIFQEAFKSCGFTTLALPGKLEAIGNEAFFGNRNLTKLILPESLESIGNAAFAGCENLREVYCPRQTPPEVQFIHSMANAGSGEANAPQPPFDKIAADAVLYVPIGTKSLYEASMFAKGFAEIRETADFPADINDEIAASDGCSVTGGKGCISISANGEPIAYKVYAAGGQLMAEGVADGTDIVEAPAGICIVSAHGEKTKVVVR